MIKILIIGGAGYIGGYMTDVFSAIDDYEVTVYDNLLYEPYYLKNVHFIRGDIRDKDKLGRIINEYDIVVILAAIVGDFACAVNVYATEEINVHAVRWLVDKYKKGTIIFMSTCSIYGINNCLIDETATPYPLSIYAATKLNAEKYIIENSKDHIIFRLGTLYGLSDMHSRPRLDLVVNIMTKRAVYGETLTVFGGEQWRPVLHVRDVCHAVEHCLNNNVRGLFNLSERNVIISELADIIKGLLPTVTITYQKQKFEDLRDYKVKTEKISATHWKPKFTLEEGIQEMINIFFDGRIRDATDSVFYNHEHLKKINFEGAMDGWKHIQG